MLRRIQWSVSMGTIVLIAHHKGIVPQAVWTLMTMQSFKLQIIPNNFACREDTFFPGDCNTDKITGFSLNM